MSRNGTAVARRRLAVEAEYMAALADAVPLDRWRRIVEATAKQAEEGDAKARDWLARHLLGDQPPSLVSIAAEAAEGKPIGDTSLLKKLMQRVGEATNRRVYDSIELGEAERILARLVRGPAEELAAKQPDHAGACNVIA